MSGEREPLVPGRSDPIFPITNRRTPVLDRVREMRRKRNSVGAKVGEKVGEMVLSVDEEEKEATAIREMEEFRESLSNQLGVPAEAINNDLVREFGALFGTLEESDVVDESVLDQTQEEPEQEVEEDEEEDDDSGSDVAFMTEEQQE